MNTLDEIIKQNSNPDLLRIEVLKNFEENISAIRNESTLLMKESQISDTRMNTLFTYINNIDQNFHNIYNETSVPDKTLKNLIKHLKDLKKNFENDVAVLNKNYISTDYCLQEIKNVTSNEHVFAISNLLNNAFECYRTLLNSFVSDDKKLNKEAFAKETFGDTNIGFLKDFDKVIIKE